MPTLTEHWHTPLPPADVLRRLGYRTAPGQLTTLGGWLTFEHYRYTDMHFFVGTLGADCFTLQALAQAGGQGRFGGFDSAWTWRPTVEGRLTAAGDGTRLTLHYGAPPVALPLVAAGLLTWFGQQLSELGWAAALLRLGLVAGVSGLALWGFFRLAVRGLRAQLMELLLLRAAPAAT